MISRDYLTDAMMDTDNYCEGFGTGPEYGDSEINDMIADYKKQYLSQNRELRKANYDMTLIFDTAGCDILHETVRLTDVYLM